MIGIKRMLITSLNVISNIFIYFIFILGNKNSKMSSNYPAASLTRFSCDEFHAP
jgi:hypothetical protein